MISNIVTGFCCLVVMLVGLVTASVAGQWLEKHFIQYGELDRSSCSYQGYNRWCDE
jgi:hypothetical protein